jgi:hypothetical protein
MALWTHLLPNQNRQKMAIFIGPSPPPLSLRHLLELPLPPLLHPLRTLPPLPRLLLLRQALLIGLQIPTHPSKLRQGLLEIPPPQMRRILWQSQKGWTTSPTPNRTTNRNPRRRLPPDVGEVDEGVIDHDCSHHFLFFHALSSLTSHILYSFVSSTQFLDVLFSLHFCVPGRPVFFTFSCSYLLYNSYPHPVPPYFSVWYSLKYF